MKRGELWTSAGGPGYASKPRPALIVQSDTIPGTDSVLACGLTSSEDSDLDLRPSITPDPQNGLQRQSEVMIDKLTAVPRTKLGRRIGAIGAEDMARVEDALALVLGFAG